MLVVPASLPLRWPDIAALSCPRRVDGPGWLTRAGVPKPQHADAIESIDINPFVVLPRGQGALALDALIVPRAAG